MNAVSTYIIAHTPFFCICFCIYFGGCVFWFEREDKMEIRLYYEERGEGFPLILLHGNGEDGTYFHHQMEYFAREYRVIAVDSRGHGKSPRGSAPFTIRQFARDLKDFMDQKGIDRAHILGFSDGGNVALCFALAYPQRVEKLILNGANLNARGVKTWVQLPVEIGYRMAGLFAKRSEKARKNWEILGLMVKDPNIPEEDLCRVEAETLVIAGAKDMIKDRHTRRIAAGIAKSRLVILEGDHFIAERRPEPFNRAVAEFLRMGNVSREAQTGIPIS